MKTYQRQTSEPFAVHGRAEGGNPDVIATIKGYAARFNSLSGPISEMGKRFREILEPGAFRSALQRSDLDVRALFNHDKNLLLGRSSKGTLRMSEDHLGLFTEIDLPDTNAGRDVLALVKRGDLAEMSFEFGITQGGSSFVREGDGLVHRIVAGGVSFVRDISAVTFPAYPATSISARAQEIQTTIEKARAAFDKVVARQEAGEDPTAEELAAVREGFAAVESFWSDTTGGDGLDLTPLADVASEINQLRAK